MSANVRQRILRLGGIMLVVLGLLHIAVTPFIIQLIANNTTNEATQWLTPPMLLNHIVVGILLLPLGALTFYSAPYAVKRERWALVVTRVTCTTVAILPVMLFSLMGTRYFDATPFIIATIILCLACATIFAAAFWPHQRRENNFRVNNQ